MTDIVVSLYASPVACGSRQDKEGGEGAGVGRRGAEGERGKKKGRVRKRGKECATKRREERYRGERPTPMSTPLT